MAQHKFPVGQNITTTQLSADPYPLFQKLLADEPVTYVPAFKMWMVARHTDVISILRDADTYTIEPPRGQINPMEEVFGQMMLSMDSTEHKRIRDVFMEPFRPQQVILICEKISVVVAIAGSLLLMHLMQTDVNLPMVSANLVVAPLSI